MKKQIIFIDFDGTIVEDNGTYPNFGDFLPYAKETLLQLQDLHYLILYSLRDDIKSFRSNKLVMAMDFLKEHGIVKIETPMIMNIAGHKYPYDMLIDDRATLDGKIDWLKIAEHFGIILQEKKEKENERF